MTNAEYVSPDGLLRFLVQTADDGVVCLGFDGSLWHLHAHDLAAKWAVPEWDAVERYVRDLLENRLVIVVSRADGQVPYVYVTNEPRSETLYLSPGNSVELRYWDGTKWNDS